MEEDFVLDFNAPPPIKCVHCNKPKYDHKAITFACPFGRGSHKQFRADKFYEPNIRSDKQPKCKPST